MTPDERLELARYRILRVLRAHRVCSLRTLENKISDAGPYGMRINPHLITRALHELQLADGQVVLIRRPNVNWYTLPSVPQAEVEARLAELEPIQKAFAQPAFAKRAGQALEVAIYRALLAASDKLFVLGAFPDLDEHEDDKPYHKEEPPLVWQGKRCLSGRLDFFVIDKQTAVAGGVEVKNGREWFYPERPEVKSFLAKCCELDLVPILVGRRLHYNTTRLLVPRGGLVRETYFQRLPEAEASLAQRARNKHLLGYHDIRLGNQPDARMLGFANQLPALLPEARKKFEAGRADLAAFAQGRTTLAELGLQF